MESRREFIKSVTAFGVAGLVGVPTTDSVAQTPVTPEAPKSDRDYWLSIVDKIASPVLENLSRRELKKVMPVEASDPGERAPADC